MKNSLVRLVLPLKAAFVFFVVKSFLLFILPIMATERLQKNKEPESSLFSNTTYSDKSLHVMRLVFKDYRNQPVFFS